MLAVPRTLWRRASTALAVFGATLSGATAWACPSCPVGRLARQQVCDQGFTHNLVIAIVPFALIGIASIWAERIGKNPAPPS
jgi:hypothetical protein